MNHQLHNDNTPKEIKKIGFIGLGNMGFPMALRLIKAGFDVTVYDIKKEPMQLLHEQGAKTAHSIQKLAEEKDLIITMLQSGELVRKVCLGDHGIYLNSKAHAIHIDTSSIDVETTRELYESAEMADVLSLDAPVSGGIVGAANGQLTFAVGGDAAVLERVMPILEVMGKRIVYTGGPGNGQAAKICNNMILGVSMIAVSEAFMLGKKLGLAPENFFEFAANASGQCWSMTNYCPYPNILENVPSSNHYKPGFAAELMLKDLHLSQKAAESVNFNTTLGKKAEELYQAFVKQQEEPIDFSGIIKMIASSSK